MSQWAEYRTERTGDFIPIREWGKDHWSTFAYAETRAVDHRSLTGLDPFGQPQGGDDSKEYPTRLKNSTVTPHDDWSCIEDMVEAGLMRAWFRVKRHGIMFGSDEAKIELTIDGQHVAAQLRAHKAGGGMFAKFAPVSPPRGMGAGRGRGMKHETIVTFFLGGRFFDEEESRVVESRDIMAVELPSNAFAFQFHTRQTQTATLEDEREIEHVEAIDKGPMYFPDGEVFNFEQVAKLEGDHEILLRNMVYNDWPGVVRTRMGNFKPYQDGMIMLAESKRLTT